MTTLPAPPQRGYYDMPMLKKPLWGWEIALYFFSEGISSGCYILATAADLFGGRKYTRLVRIARIVSLATLVPCPPMLIADLGRPERFHHMLRIFKPSSPMNLGAWALTAFSLPVAMLLLVRGRAARAISIAGLGPAFIMMSYPGVLLATTSIPVWTGSRFLGPLLASSSMSMAAAAVRLGLAFTPRRDQRAGEVLNRIEIAAHICEAGALAGYIRQTGPAASPLIRGSQAPLFWLGAIGCGVVLPIVIERIAGKRPGRAASIASGACRLIGGLALKWALVHAGRESAMDPEATRRITAATDENPGWYAIKRP